eukprot:scaffold2548_cov121-Isochrysis_galbana.AAC.3
MSDALAQERFELCLELGPLHVHAALVRCRRRRARGANRLRLQTPAPVLEGLSESNGRRIRLHTTATQATTGAALTHTAAILVKRPPVEEEPVEKREKGAGGTNFMTSGPPAGRPRRAHGRACQLKRAAELHVARRAADGVEFRQSKARRPNPSLPGRGATLPSQKRMGRWSASCRKSGHQNM